MRTRALLAMLLLGSVVVTAGCEKTPHIERVMQTLYLGFPAGLEELQTVDLYRLRNKPDVADAYRKSSFKTTMDEMEAELGFNPWEDIDLINLGTRGRANPETPYENAVLIARGGFQNPGAVLEKLHGWLAEEVLIAPPAFRRGTHPGTEYPTFQTQARSQYNANIELTLQFGFPNENLMVFSLNSGLFRETLDVIAGNVEGLMSDEQWRPRLQRPDIGATFWGTGAFPREELQAAVQESPALEQIPVFAQLMAVQEYYYNLEFNNAINGELGLVCDSIETATALTNQFRQSMSEYQQVKPFLVENFNIPRTAELPEKLFITAELETTKIVLSLSEKDYRALRLEWKKLAEQFEQGQFMDALDNPADLIAPQMPMPPAGEMPGQAPGEAPGPPPTQ